MSSGGLSMLPRKPFIGFAKFRTWEELLSAQVFYKSGNDWCCCTRHERAAGVHVSGMGGGFLEMWALIQIVENLGGGGEVRVWVYQGQGLDSLGNGVYLYDNDPIPTFFTLNTNALVRIKSPITSKAPQSMSKGKDMMEGVTVEEEQAERGRWKPIIDKFASVLCEWHTLRFQYLA
ncbi:hypothetical protein IW261DRAFT_1420783 [Armillaria novae-zelandiae]|uniref:Uncharacterized protein n=1 Tax=Armillaria novae-zelandiae TaxID=153914 RepID=A0AA39TBF6_9AGAR|nr:hypothetical protein IW261DRAFT_1420783 [Armillaria novae-zelandiae]